MVLMRSHLLSLITPSNRVCVRFLKGEGAFAPSFFMFYNIFLHFFLKTLAYVRLLLYLCTRNRKRMNNTSSGETEEATLGSDLGGIAG